MSEIINGVKHTTFDDIYNELPPERRAKIERNVARYTKIIEKRDNALLASIVLQLEKFAPIEIRLFGSFGTNCYKPGVSNIDFCIIAETDNKIELLADMYSCVDKSLPIDLVLFTPGEWIECTKDPDSFASFIKENGRLIFGDASKQEILAAIE